jgi:hypothetical protein
MSMSFVTVTVVCTVSIALGLMCITMIVLVTFPVVMTAFALQIGFVHGFVIMFVPVFVTMLMAVNMTVPFLLPVKISQVIFTFLLAIMAVCVFADLLICLTMLGQFMVPSILGFIRVGQRACRRQKEQNKWDDQHFCHSWISLQSALEVEFERELATYHRIYGPHRPGAVEIRGSAGLPPWNRSVYARVAEPRARLPICHGNREDPFLQEFPIDSHHNF